MKPIACLVLVSLCFAAAASAAESQTVESTITEVALFNDGARVSRVAPIAAPAGPSVFRFEGLPTSSDQSMLQASIGSAKGVIRNAKLFIPDFREESERVKAAQAQLDAHRRSERAIEEDKTIAQGSIRFAEEMSRSFAQKFGEIEQDAQSLTIEQARHTWNLVDSTRREALAAIEAADEKLRELQRQRKELEEALRQAVEADNLTQAVAEVEIDLDAAQSIELAISYQAYNANWQPRYELRAKPEESLLNFGYSASIYQNTGENWDRVRLTLHTNSASRRGNVPELPPMRLEQAIQYKSYTLGAGQSDAVFMQAEAAPALAARSKTLSAPSEQRAEIASSTVSFQATLPAPASIPSSRNRATIAVLEQAFPASYWSETVPKLSLEAFLRAKAINKLELPILPGEALAFVDGELSSKVYLQKTLPGEELELSLGLDPRIVVKRIEGAQEDKNSGLIDKTVTLTRSYTNKVTSYHVVPHKVVVVDQFPIATDAKIKIERISPKPEAVIVDDDEKESGLFQWESLIAPKETKSFLTEYKIQHPRDWEIIPQP